MTDPTPARPELPEPTLRTAAFSSNGEMRDFYDADAVRAIIAQARAELIAEITATGPEVYKWRTASRAKTGTPGPWHLSMEPFNPVPREVDEIACYVIPSTKEGS